MLNELFSTQIDINLQAGKTALIYRNGSGNTLGSVTNFLLKMLLLLLVLVLLGSIRYFYTFSFITQMCFTSIHQHWSHDSPSLGSKHWP